MLAGLAVAEAEAPAADQAGEEIVVTGERFERTLRETAASVSVTTETELDKQAAPDRIEQVLALVPNVQLGAGDQGPSIRGQESTGVLQGADAFLGGSRPRATIQIDGRALGYNEFIYGLSSVWDVARIEVFRGPQTTTQGRNAIAGAVFIETNDPTFDHEGRVRGIVGDYDTYQGSAAVSGPIVADQLAARVAVDVRNHRSFVRYDSVTVTGADISEDDYALVRARLRAEPTALPGLRLDLTYAHLDSRAPQGEAIDAPFRARRRALGDGGYFKTNVDSLVGALDYAIARDAAFSFTAAYGDARIERFAPPGGGNAVIDATDLSLEGIVTFAPADGRVQALAGLYYLDTDQDEFIDLSSFLGLGDFTDEQHSFGVFGEATLTLTGALSLTAGARYQRDTQDRRGFLGTPAFGFAVDYDRAFDAFLPKVALAYDLSSDLRIGASAQRGFNPGGTTISFTTGLQDIFEQETLWNYEIFARGSAYDGKFRLSANAFYTDYKDSQRPLTSVIVRPDGSRDFETEIDNAPSARSYGIEAEAAFSPTRRVDLRVGLGLLDTEIEETLDPLDPLLGQEFQRAPRFTAALGASWRPVDGLALDTTLRHNSDYFSDDANTRALAINGTTVVDAKLSYTYRGVTAFAFARNLFDDFYLTQLYAVDFGTAGDPQEIGIGLEARF